MFDIGGLVMNLKKMKKVELELLSNKDISCLILEESMNCSILLGSLHLFIIGISF